jgi:PPOX class probable F420-dependent enzyme
VAPTQLKRIRNIAENPQVALVVDRYSDDWSELAYLLIEGSAILLPPDHPAHRHAIALLRTRYPQYIAIPIELQPVIAVRPTNIVAWGALDRG